MKAFLAGNAIRNDNGKPYFPLYTVIKRHGLKIAILGYDNANIAGWLSERLWSGMKFENLIPLVQQDVDKVIAKEKPHVVIVATHTATGSGDGSQLESQGLDLMKNLKGVDFLVCSHDHRPTVVTSDTLCLINSGSHCRYVGEGKLDVTVRKGKVEKKSVSAHLILTDRYKIDTLMAAKFHDDYVAVKEFTTREVGELKVNLATRDAYKGQCDYLNLIHTLSITCSPAQLSFAAPLTYNGNVKAGTLIYNDLFTIYPFENQLYVIRMTGKEIKDYLEASYDNWINTVSSPSDHVLKIVDRDDPRTGQKSWSFVGRSYNFDSAAGMYYTVDVTKPRGERVVVDSLVGGASLEPDKTYNVAVTSYRASGGGGLMQAAGVDTGKIEGLPLNRALRDDDGTIYDVVAGPFLVAGLAGDSFGSLTPEQMTKYEQQFHQPEMFIHMGKGIMALPMPDDTVEMLEERARAAEKSAGKNGPEKKPENRDKNPKNRTRRDAR